MLRGFRPGTRIFHIQCSPRISSLSDCIVHLASAPSSPYPVTVQPQGTILPLLCDSVTSRTEPSVPYRESQSTTRSAGLFDSLTSCLTIHTAARLTHTRTNLERSIIQVTLLHVTTPALQISILPTAASTPPDCSPSLSSPPSCSTPSAPTCSTSWPYSRSYSSSALAPVDDSRASYPYNYPRSYDD